jgi:hypothetical protein
MHLFDREGVAWPDGVADLERLEFLGLARTHVDLDHPGYNTRTYGGDQVSTWSILRQSRKPRSPVGLVKQPGNNVSADNENALALAA